LISMGQVLAERQESALLRVVDSGKQNEPYETKSLDANLAFICVPVVEEASKKR